MIRDANPNEQPEELKGFDPNDYPLEEPIEDILSKPPLEAETEVGDIAEEAENQRERKKKTPRGETKTVAPLGVDDEQQALRLAVSLEATKDAREKVYQIQIMISKGMATSAIRRYATSHWGMTENQASGYIVDARKQLREDITLEEGDLSANFYAMLMRAAQRPDASPRDIISAVDSAAKLLRVGGQNDAKSEEKDGHKLNPEQRHRRLASAISRIMHGR